MVKGEYWKVEGEFAMKISVICTVKNGGSIIVPTIKSILSQTIANWEFIIIDDGSKDSTAVILQYFSKIEPRIKVIATTGIGRAQALNLALENAQGQYIANIDADDPSHPKRLEAQLKVMEERPEIACLVSDFLLINGNRKPLWPIEKMEEAALTVKVIDKETLMKRNPINHSSLFIRKIVLQKLGGYNEKRQTLLDYDLWLRLIGSGEKIYQLQSVLATKRIHSKQSFERNNRLKYLLDTRNLKNDYIQKYNFSAKYKALAELSVLYGLFPQFLRYYLKKLYSKVT